MKHKYRILHIEDSETDAELVEIELQESKIPFDYKLIDTANEFIESLDSFQPDIILCDHSLPSFNSFEALRVLKQKRLNVPFIVITATMTEEVAIAIVREGAEDYILKDRLKRLPYVVMNAIDKYRNEQERKQMITEAYEKEAAAKEMLVQLSGKLLLATKSAGLGIWEWDLKTGKLDWDEGMFQLYNINQFEFGSVYDGWMCRLQDGDKKRVNEEIEKALANEKPYDTEYGIVWPDGTTHCIKATGTIERDMQGQAVRMIGINQDITKSKEAEQTVKDSEAKYRAFFESSLDGIFLTSPDGRIYAANEAACKLYQMTEEEICKAGRQNIVDKDQKLAEFLAERKQNGKVQAELTGIRKSGERFPIDVSSALFTDTTGEVKTSMIMRDITERKKAEREVIIMNEALEQALGELRKIMDSSVDVICTIDDNGRFANVSLAAEKIWRYKPEELIGKNYFSYLHKEDLQNTLQIAGRLIKGEPFTTFENRFVCKDGSVVPLLWSGKRDRNDGNTYCVAKDVTDKKRLELALENERERFYKLFTEAPLCIGVLKGANHAYDFANPYYLNFIGKSNIIGKTVSEVLPEVVEQGFIKILDDVYTTGKPFIANEVPVKLDMKNDGVLIDNYVNIVYQAYTGADDKIEGIFFFTIDVTEQVVSRKKIEKSEKRYRQIVETAQEGIWTIDENSKTTFVNRKMCDILGYTEKEMLGQTNLSFKSADEQKKASEQLERRKQGQSEMHDTTYITKSGQTIHAHVSTNPIMSIDGRYKGALAMVTDITDRKLAELERNRLVNDLIMRNKDLEQFTYMVSHNLRAPVANIIGMTNIMIEDSPNIDDTKIICEGISESVNKLDNVVKDLNQILQIKSDTGEIKETVFFSKLVDDIKISINHMLAGDIKVDYDFSEANELVTIKSYLYSTFFNLITNSIKFRQPHIGCVIFIKSRRTENGIELIFTDNGLGIDLRLRGNEVFGLYKRFHNNNVEGRGIGLFMVKTQVEAIKGKISIESEVEKGTTFKINLDI